jgi:hypothetical protein
MPYFILNPGEIFDNEVITETLKSFPEHMTDKDLDNLWTDAKKAQSFARNELGPKYVKQVMNPKNKSGTYTDEAKLKEYMKDLILDGIEKNRYKWINEKVSSSRIIISYPHPVSSSRIIIPYHHLV